MRLITDIFAFCQDRRAALEHDLDLRLPHPRGGLHGGAGGGASRSPTASPTWRRRSRPGLSVDEFAPQLSFFFNAHNNLLEEVAKFRAARRLWARHHARALPRAGPALADAALPRADRGQHAHRPAAGEQHRARDRPGPGRGARRAASRCTPTRMDEALVAAHARRRCASRCAPSRSSPTSRAWPTPSIPLGGSYAVERLTGEIEERGRRPTSPRSTGFGGSVHAIAFMQREIQEAAYRYQQEVEAKARVVVGVNEFVDRRAAAGEPLPGRPRGRASGWPSGSSASAPRGTPTARGARSTRSTARPAARDNLLCPILEAVRPR